MITNNYVSGVDEAGRGAVLGPLVISSCTISKDKEDYFKEIEDSDQFKYYYDHINNNYNFQALHKGELIDGEDWQPTFVMQSEDKNV